MSRTIRWSATFCVAMLVMAIALPADASVTSKWTQVRTPSPNSRGYLDGLSDISCVGSTWCWAVGGEQPGEGAAGGSGPGGPLAELWSGGRWTAKALPNLPGAYLAGDSCVTRTFCVAIEGDDSLIEGNDSLIWNGANWSIVPTAGLSGSLNAVSCTSASWCMAVGSGGGTLAELWNGSDWTVLPTPNPSDAMDSSSLSAISCVGPSFCEAIGTTTTGALPTVDTTLAEDWNGTEWALQSSPDTADGYDTLASVSCASSTACVAVGSHSSSSSGVGYPLALRFAGTTWSLMHPPHLKNVRTQGVACISSTTCLAVAAATKCPLVLSVIRTSWKQIPSNGLSDILDLAGIACSASGRCLAVGTACKPHNTLCGLTAAGRNF